MIAHTLHEESFVKLTVEQFELINNKHNLYVFFDQDKYKRFKANYPSIPLIFWKAKNDLKGYDIKGVIIHFLTFESARFIIDLPGNVPVLWSSYGYDLYESAVFSHYRLYGKATADYIRSTRRYPSIVYSVKQSLLNKLSSEGITAKKALKKVDFVSSVVPTEFCNFPDGVQRRAKYIRINMGLHRYFDEFTLPDFTRSDEFSNLSVYVGNNTRKTNNHLDLIPIILGSELKHDFIFNLQLSYPDSESVYSRYVRQEFQNKLSNRINVYSDFLDYESYKRILGQNSIFLFNSYRQQGMGAIYDALWSGGKVFLSEKNPALSYLKDLGVRIFSLERDLPILSEAELKAPFDNEVVFHNRRCLLADVSDELRLKRAKTAVDTLIDQYEHPGMSKKKTG